VFQGEEKMKKCCTCKEIKTFEMYSEYSKSSDGYWNSCKVCQKEKDKEWRQAHKSEIKDQQLQKLYGITLQNFEQMRLEQEYRCGICSSMAAKGTGTFCVDHSHRTSKVRGLLCLSCNALLGHWDDNPELLENAAKYLRRAEEKS